MPLSGPTYPLGEPISRATVCDSENCAPSTWKNGMFIASANFIISSVLPTAVGQVEDGRRRGRHVLLGQAAEPLHAGVLGRPVERVQHEVEVVLVRAAGP